MQIPLNSNFFAIILCFVLLSMTACLPPSSLLLGRPDKKDLERFDHRVIEAGDDCFTFHSSTGTIGQRVKVNDWTSDLPFFVGLDELVESHAVRSFLVIRKDTILYEYYGEETKADDLHSSYSIAKSFTSALIGVAIEEGKIYSEQDLVIKYIPELKGAVEFETLTIEHLLNHTSGIKYRLDVDATIYYGRNSLKALDKIEFEYPPGTHQHYVNMNTHLLGLIIHRATGKYPARYLEEKIWKPIGMCSNGIWAIDKKNDLEKSYCCMGATAEDYAKFGRLYMNEGNWNGEQIVSKEWYQKSIRRDTSQGSSFNYNYCWHIGLAAYGDFMANGAYKQHIYIYPEKEIIIVSMNNREKKIKAERINWWYVFRQIVDQL